MSVTTNLVFKGYKVKDIQFRAVDNPPGVKNFKLNPKIGFSLRKIDKGFDILMSAAIEKQEDPVPFEFNIGLVGRFFVLGVDADIKVLAPRAAEILFPYLRTVVSSVTMNANVPPYILPTIDIAKLFEKINIQDSSLTNSRGGSEITKVYI
ncbi:MAG: protein-export chaperone SecB [Bacillota bacterium]|jgi:preprotein translocase subunit SecB|nr:protein-export chaperone SecB [Bacillota bacterium]HHU43558.1 hypothetical protein [Clostridiales bacterium]